MSKTSRDAASLDQHVRARQQRALTVAALKTSITIIEMLADQQAMPDNFYVEGLDRIKDVLAQLEKDTI